ncbi:MAG: hypothetical protein JJT94_02135 [Bernardetiaceae bacterium]|nr:hypothetical protein [Bernardetiaceae bacterium]
MMNKPKPQQKKSRKTTIKKLIEFIEQQLYNFPNSQEFIDILELKKNENQHSLSFCVFMTNICKSKYYFARENSQAKTSTVDIGIYQGSMLIFTIEAKVLPIPAREEYEYVYGKGGGIQRFKDNKHGLNNKGDLLPENAMIAYIKAHDFEYWLNQINQWILDAGWCVEEILTPKYPNQNNKYISKHMRIDNSTLTLHHFWVNLT